MSVVIVTGASSGIGRSIAKYLLTTSNTTKVFLTARTEKPLLEFVKEYGDDRVSYHIGDLCDLKVPKEVVNKIISKFGTINSIIANAGMLEPVEPVGGEINVEKWRKLFDLNYFSVVELTHLSMPYLKKNNGNVILVSSGASTKCYSGWSAYGASKAAINHFALSLATEVPEIKAIAVAPGVVNTKMQTSIREEFGKKMEAKSFQRFIDLHKNNELLDPDYVAKLYANLAIKGINSDLNGKYVRYNDESLKSYYE